MTDNALPQRICRCRNYPKFAGHHVVGERTFWRHFIRARRNHNLTDFDQADIANAIGERQYPPVTTNSIHPPLSNSDNGNVVEENSPASMYDDSDEELEDEDDARNIRNWVDDVDNAFDVFGMDQGHNYSNNLPDSGIEDMDEIDPHDIDDLLKYIELHRFYRNIGRRMWKSFQRIMDIFYGVRIQDGDTYGRKVRGFVRVPTQKIDRCRLGHMAFTGRYATETKCLYKSKREICGQARYMPKMNPNNPEEVRIPVSQLDYIPLKHRLVEQFRNATRARELQSFHRHISLQDMTDWIHGRVYQRLKAEGFFRDCRELAVQMSLDEITLTDKRMDKNLHKVMVVFIYLLNLDPRVRFNKSNTLLSMVIPGGYDNNTLDTFLQPLVDELKLLSIDGVPAVDASRGNEKFRLRAHLVLVTGDGRAVAKAMGMKEPGNTSYPCRSCEIKASRDGTTGLYIPHTGIDLQNLPLRQNLAQAIDNWQPAAAPDFDKGISRRSLLREIPTLYWPDSFPVDTMHCIAHNLSQDIFRLLWGAKWATLASPDNQGPYCVSRQNKAHISNALREAKSTVPAYIAPPPREIRSDDIKQLKTAEWKAFLLVYGPALMQETTGRAYWKNLLDLSRLYGILLNRTLRPSHIATISNLATRFVRQHEKLYYTDLRSSNSLPRIQVCTLQRHSLLHLADDVRNWGPASIFAQWLPEGYLGYIKREADSPSHMIRSLIDGVLDDDRYNIAMYMLNKYVVEDTIISTGFTQEKTVTLRKGTMVRRLRDWMRHKDRTPCDCPLDARIFAAYRIASGALITAIGFQRRTEVNRKNCYIAYYWSDAATRKIRFGEVQCFAEVTGNNTWNLAYVIEWNCTSDEGCYTKISIKDQYWFEARLIVGLVGLVAVKVSNGAIRQRIVGKDGIYNEVERDM